MGGELYSPSLVPLAAARLFWLFGLIRRNWCVTRRHCANATALQLIGFISYQTSNEMSWTISALVAAAPAERPDYHQISMKSNKAIPRLSSFRATWRRRGEVETVRSFQQCTQSSVDSARPTPGRNARACAGARRVNWRIWLTSVAPTPGCLMKRVHASLSTNVHRDPLATRRNNKRSRIGSKQVLLLYISGSYAEVHQPWELEHES